MDPTELLNGLIGESFSGNDVQLELDPPGTWLSLDPVRIRLLARNLLTNAIRHTPPGGPPPSVTSHVDDEHWRLVVSDSGPGVGPEQISRLTDPFYRVDTSRQRASGSVGLGLYLCRAIAEAHGGSLGIDSAPGRGTRVTLSVPVSDDG